MERPVGLLQLLEGGQLFLQLPLMAIFIFGGIWQLLSIEKVAGEVG